MQIQTTRFGTIEYGDEDTLIVRDGLLGFPNCAHFLVLNHKEGSAFRWLQSVEDPDVAFLAIDPAQFTSEYAPQLPSAAAEALELTDDTPRLVYALVSIPPGLPGEMTANLAGPLVINAEKRLAAQVVVEDSRWSTRHRILDEMRAIVAIKQDAA